MAHEFESGFFGGNQAAWHQLGTVIPDQVVDSAAAIKLAGLDWEVRKEQLQHSGIDIDGKFVTVRDAPSGGIVTPHAGIQSRTTIQPLGVVGSKFVPVQNIDSFALGDALVQATKGAAHWHTAGSLAGGRRVWMLLELGQYNVGAEGEDINQYLLISNAHDGTAALQAMLTDVRVVCQNTLIDATRTARRKFSIRHTGDVTSRIEEAQLVLGIAQQRTIEVQTEATELLLQQFGTPEFKRMIEAIVPIAEDATDRAVSMAQNKREALYTGYKMSDNIDNIRGTKWGALQAVVEVNDHVLTSRTNAERRFDQILGGSDLVAEAHGYLIGV